MTTTGIPNIDFHTLPFTLFLPLKSYTIVIYQSSFYLQRQTIPKYIKFSPLTAKK
jgi:hypothetical protein